MNTVGFITSHKNNEKRRALLPEDIRRLEHSDCLFFEAGYGSAVGVSDEEYTAAGAHIVTREQALGCDVIVDVKLGDADYLDSAEPGRTFVGWAHTVQNTEFTGRMLQGSHTVVAWEELYENGRYLFYRNRELAGEAAIMHAFRYCGRMPYDAKVAIIGNGQTAKGAFRILAALGAEVDIFARKHESLFRRSMYDYDVIVNCVFWDTSRTDRLIYREDLKKMKKGTLIIDVSCDPNLEIETSHPTSIDDPVYEVDGVLHYAVDNIPALFPLSVTKSISAGFAPYVDALVSGCFPENLRAATVIEKGHILDARITAFREARGLFCK